MENYCKKYFLYCRTKRRQTSDLFWQSLDSTSGRKSDWMAYAFTIYVTLSLLMLSGRAAVPRQPRPVHPAGYASPRSLQDAVTNGGETSRSGNVSGQCQADVPGSDGPMPVSFRASSSSLCPLPQICPEKIRIRSSDSPMILKYSQNSNLFRDILIKKNSAVKDKK